MDPKPYIRTFEAALQQLQKIHGEVSRKEQQAAKAAEQGETNYSEQVISISRNMGGVINNFGSLDNTVGDIFTATSSLNNHLEKLSIQFERSVESGFLINCFLAFYRNNTCLELDKMWEGQTLDRKRCANVTRQLQILSKKIDGVQGAENARDAIDKFAEKIERDLLTVFDNAYRSADLKAMKDSADILTDFNGGSSVVQLFVNQHDYFINQEKLYNIETLQNEAMWEHLSDPDGDSTELEKIMQSLVDEIERVIVNELEIIRKVFTKKVAVLKVFLQRVFAQRIQQQVEACLVIAEKKSTLTYMRSLHICYSKVGALTKSLKDVFTKQNIDSEGELTALLDQNFADIFVPYIESGRYFEAEVRNLNEIMAFVLVKFTASQKHFAKDYSLLSRFTGSLNDNPSASRENLPVASNASATTQASNGAANSEKGQGRIGQLMRAVRLDRTTSHAGTMKSSNGNSGTTTPGEEDRGEQEVTEFYNSVKLEQIQKILSYAAESIKRDLELAESKEIPNDAKTFLHLLLDNLGRDVAETLLDEAIATSSNQDPRYVDLGFLKVVKQVSGFIYLISETIKTVIAPMMQNNSALRQHTVNSLNTYLTRCEHKLNTIIQNAIDVCLARINLLLSKQKKKDYTFKSNEISNLTNTPTCIEVCQFLSHIYDSLTESLDGKNLSIVLIEIGDGFRDLILDHYKKFNVSEAGGLVVSKDVQEYQIKLDEWSVPEVTEEFSVVHNVANLFTVQYVIVFFCFSSLDFGDKLTIYFFRPDSIQSLIRGSKLSQVKPYILREYLQRRLDYFTAGINKLVSTLFKTKHHLLTNIYLFFVFILIGISKHPGSTGNCTIKSSILPYDVRWEFIV